MKKALVIRLSSLGDVVLSSVLIDPLVNSGYKVFLLTFKPYHQLFEDDWRVNTIPTTKGDLFSHDFIRNLRKKKFDLFVDIHRNIKTFRLRLALGGKWVSYKKDSLRRRLAVRFERFRKPFYVTEAYLKALGKLSEGASPLPKILLSEERLSRLREFLPSEEFVVLAPGARYKKKAYPYYRELAGLLRENNFEVVWVGDEEDRKRLGKVEGVNLCGRLGLADVLGVIRLGSVFVGNDSGLLHCARAVKTPAVQIYGGTHPTLGFSLYPEEGKVVIKGLECQPCDIHGKGECKLGDYRCLDIDPRLILSETLRLVRAKSSRG